MNKKLFSLLFFFSGLCGLVYQILWTRQFSSILGNTYLAISIVVASFMGGLFLGAWLIGRLIHKCSDELKWYAYLEVIIGGYALLFLFSFGFIEMIYDGLYSSFGGISFLYSMGMFLLTLFVIVVPTSAMGATLPLAVQYFTKNKKYFMGNISALYAVNTVGGAAGSLFGGFFLIEYLGIKNSLILTAGINIIIGMFVFFRNSEKEFYEVTKEPHKHKKKNKLQKPKDDNKILYLFAAGLAGFTALAYEVLWIRGLKFLVHSSTYSFSIVLFIFLVGIAIGSRLAQKMVKRNTRLHFVYGLLQITLGLYAVLTMYLLYVFSYTDFFQKNIINIIYDFSFNWLWGIGVYILISALILLIPTIVMGILFPLINNLSFKKNIKKTGQTVSLVYAVNTIGSILGSLSAGFILLPLFGIKTSIIMISVINLILGAIFMVKEKVNIVPTVSITVILFFFFLSLSFDGKYLLGRGERKEDKVLFYEEGLMSTVKVFERRKQLYMNVDGMNIASTNITLLQKEKLIAHLPFLIKPGIKEVLAVGLGSGISVGSIALYEDVEKIDCVELIKPVFAGASYFAKYNNNIFDNKRINLIYDDAYTYLKNHKKTYDLISSDGKLGSLYSGNTVVLSADYYNLSKSRLKKDGIFIQWMPIITPHEVLKVVLSTLKKSFNHVSLFYFYPSDILMLASDSPIIMDKTHTDKVFSDDKKRGELKTFGLKNSVSLFSSFIGIYELSPGERNRINSFNKPILEFEYMREWKKGRLWEGGYRAKNLQFLVDNYKKTKLDLLSTHFKDIEKSDVEKNIYVPSLGFFDFCIMNFKRGSFQRGLQEYKKFKENLKLN